MNSSDADMIKNKGPDRVMSQQRCEIQIGQAKQFGADGDLNRLAGQACGTRAQGWKMEELLMGTGALSADHMRRVK